MPDTNAGLDLKREIAGWHAHVYYDADSRADAGVLREAIEARFDIRMGRWRDKPVGPHPMWSYQVAFRPEIFAEIVPWLAQHRGELIVLVHPETGNDLIDHRDYPIWMGPAQTLDLSVLSSGEDQDR